MFDVEAGQVVITRDVNCDESTFGFTKEPSSEEVDDAMLDLDLLEINDDDVRQVNYRQTGKRKSLQQCCAFARPPNELAGV